MKVTVLNNDVIGEEISTDDEEIDPPATEPLGDGPASTVGPGAGRFGMGLSLS